MLQFSSLIAISMLLVITFVTYLIMNTMQQQAEVSLVNRADSLQYKIEDRLDYIIEKTKFLAKNELMINALIDEDGKIAYLTPLVKNFTEDKNVVTLHVVDFDGKAIFKTKDNIPQYSKSVHLRRSLAMGDTTYYISENNTNIIVISPIKYYNTTQGSLIAEYDLKGIVNKYMPKESFVYVKLFKDNTDIYSFNFNKDEVYYSHRLPLRHTAIFNKLGLTLEMGILESIYIAPIKSAIVKLSLLGLVILVIGIFISYLMATTVSNPILKLYHKVKEKNYDDKYEALGTDDELETLAKAFYDKTKKLELSQEMYLNLYNNSPDMYVSVDAKSAKVIACNKTAANKLGYSKEEILDKEIFDLYHQDCMDDVHKAFDSFVTTGIVNNAELELKRKDGSKIYVLLIVSAVKDDDGNIIHSNSTWRDITTIKEHEEEIKENKALLYQQSKMASMGEMIGNIAHQWRQPISAISMTALNLRATVELNEEITKNEMLNYSANIEKQCDFLSKTIDDFRNFFKPNKNKNEFFIQNSIDKTMELLSASFKTHDIEVIKDIEKIKLLTFENELTQALLNIIKNAKDILLTLKNTRRLIFIKAYEKNKVVFIEITDNGGGVAPKIIDKLFEPYFTTKDKSRGTGIGLYMTQSIVTKHLNGNIYVENIDYEYDGEKYSGAKFTIEIPLV
ncbi:PAS domain S-box protein [Sulfurimonas sp.]